MCDKHHNGGDGCVTQVYGDIHPGQGLLTPDEVRAQIFTTVRLREGYELAEVDTFLGRVEATLTRLLHERQELRQRPASRDCGGEGVGRMLARAQEMADEMIAEAHEEAERILQAARESAATLEQEAQERHRAAMAALEEARAEQEREISDLLGRAAAGLSEQIRQQQGLLAELQSRPAARAAQRQIIPVRPGSTQTEQTR
ncbi:DivIVA domain-containing protein [Nonomuraea sp. 10N515B]|uniref:DivIVA domain-containing protein n=1 Tax=Nonomuraea sp. 10N515B TaxID=3457422 RepID=UPI003FCD864C